MSKEGYNGIKIQNNLIFSSLSNKKASGLREDLVYGDT